jgi:hypothetical protein
MDAKAWKSYLGESAWSHLTHVEGGSPAPWIESSVAAILTRATELGFQPPTGRPVMSPTGTKVLFPAEDGSDRVVPVLTAAGLLQHWRNRGHGFLLLRAEQVLKATAGPLYPWLQAIMNAYEDQCARDGVDPAVVNWRVFVGGKSESVTSQELLCLYDQCPKPNPAAVKRLHIAGPGKQ